MKQPKHCIVLKIIWVISLVLSIILGIILLGFLGAGEPVKMTATFTLLLCSFIVAFILVFSLFSKAFEPEFDKMKKKRELYKKYQGRVLEEEYYSIDADIRHRSIKKRVKSIREGFDEQKCPKCGDIVDANENFCNNCGETIYNKCSNCGTIYKENDKFCRGCGNILKEQ